MKILRSVLTLSFTALALAPAECRGQTASGGFHADLSMYMLGAGMSGNTVIRGIPAEVDVPFSEIWENLQFGAMGRAALRFGRVGFSTDVIYMGLGAARNGIDVGFDQWLVQPVVEVAVSSWLSPYAGARYLSMEGEIRGPQGRTGSGSQSWWDPVVGSELRLPGASKLRLRVRGDVGGFGVGSNLSWQVEPVLDWRVARHISMQFGYRWLYADYETGTRNSLFRYDMLTQGPQFGATFHF